MATTNTTVDTADQLAQEAGYDNATAYINALNSQIASASITAQNNGKNAAASFVNSLLKLVLYQEIRSDYNLNKYTWIDRFDDERIKAGNGKEYIKNVLTGCDDYDINTFNPSVATKPLLASTYIGLYDDDGNLNKYGFKVMKPLTILESNWLPYFMSGRLQEFIASQVDIMRKSMFFYKYKVFSTLLTDIISDDSTIYKVNGTASNIQTCFVNEIFPLIEDMQYFNNKYAIDEDANSSYMTISNRDDLLILMNRNTLNRFKNGVLSNTLLNNLVNWNNILPVENIIGTGLNVTVGDSNTALNVGKDELLAENQVLIVNKNAFKYLWYVEIMDSQKYITNMSIQHVHHLWGVFGTLPWEQAVLYTNDALTTLPVTTA